MPEFLNDAFLLDTVPCSFCIIPLVDEMLPVVVVMVKLGISLESVILVSPLNALLFINRGFYILMQLLTLNALTLVKLDLIKTWFAQLVFDICVF